MAMSHPQLLPGPGLCSASAEGQAPPLTSTTSAQASEPTPLAITRRPRARGWTLRDPPVLTLTSPCGKWAAVRLQWSEDLSSMEGLGEGGGILGTYFLLSSLARQVAASTALMVAARSPPCSRACSP